MDTMDVKGQASVEYLLLALVFLIIIGSVTVPLISTAISDSLDISHTSDASAALNSIANAVGIVYANGPGAKRTLNVFFSRAGTISYANNSLQMSVPLSNGVNKTVDSSVPIAVTLSPNGNILNNTNYNATVTWATGSSPINVALTQV